MSMQTEHHLISQLEENYKTGYELLGLIYSQRSLSRSITDEENPKFSAEYCEQLCHIFENEFLSVRKLHELQSKLFNTLRTAVQYLANNWVNHGHALIHTDINTAVIRNIGLLHLLDSVKHNKRTLYKDAYFLENFMQTVLNALSENDSPRNIVSTRLDEIKKIRSFLATRWSLLNMLLTVLSDVSRAPSVFSSLSEFIAKAMSPKYESNGPVFLEHDKVSLLTALPFTLYLNHFLNKKSLIDEMIPGKVMESCFKLLKRYPVIPGIGDNCILLHVPIMGIPFAHNQFGKDIKKHQVTSLDECDSKHIEQLESCYSLKHGSKEVRETHDHLCETLSMFIRDSEKWKAVQGRLPPQVYDGAMELLYRTLDTLSRWRAQVLELFAWRKTTPSSVKDPDKSDSNANTASSPMHTYKRVRRAFHESEVTEVLEVMMCVQGLSNYLNEINSQIIPYVYEWIDRSIQRFLEQSEKRKGYMDSMDPKTIFLQLQIFKELVLEGKSYSGIVHDSSKHIGNNKADTNNTSCNGVSSSHSSSHQDPEDVRNKDLIFDCRDHKMILELKWKTEELHNLCNTIPGKSKLTSLICGAPHLLAPNLLKTTRDLLRELYVISEVLKVNKHLKEIQDFSDLGLREIEIEMCGIPRLDENYCIVTQLARGAARSPLGGSLIPFLDTFDIFELASQRSIKKFNSLVSYLEIRERAFHALEKLFEEICDKAIGFGKYYTCTSLLGLDPKIWIDAKHVPNGITHRYHEFFKRRAVQLAGCDVDIQSILKHKLDKAIYSEIFKMYQDLSNTKNPSLISGFHTKIEILKGCHEWLCTHLNLIPWDNFFSGLVESTDFESEAKLDIKDLLLTCVRDHLFKDYYFEMKSRKFKTKQKDIRESNSRDFHLNSKYWTEPSHQSNLIQQHLKQRLKEPNANSKNIDIFSLKDVVSLCNLLTNEGIKDMVDMVQRYIEHGLLDFLSTELRTVIQALPEELIGMCPTEALGNLKTTSAQCLQWLLRKLGGMMNDVVFWEQPMKKLESVGNALVFLYMVEVALKAKNMTCHLAYNHTLTDISNLSVNKRKAKEENTAAADHEKTGNFTKEDLTSPFDTHLENLSPSENSILKFLEKTGTPIAPLENNKLIKECIKNTQKQILDKVKEIGNKIESGISAILFVKTFLQGNSHFGGSFLGDGVVWASQVLIGMTGRVAQFEATDWTLDIVSLADIDSAQNCFQASNDVKLFFKNALKAAESWWHISRLNLFDPLITATLSKSFKTADFVDRDQLSFRTDKSISFRSQTSNLGPLAQPPPPSQFTRDPPLPRFCNTRIKSPKKHPVRRLSSPGPLRMSLSKSNNKKELEGTTSTPSHTLTKAGYSNIDPYCDFNNNIMMSFDNNPFSPHISPVLSEDKKSKKMDKAKHQYFVEKMAIKNFERPADSHLGKSLHTSFITRTTHHHDKR